MPARQGYTAVFLSVALLMAAAVFALILTIREKKLAVEQAGQEPTTPRQSTMGNGPENSPISGDVRKSLYYLLASIFLWFTAYNVVNGILQICRQGLGHAGKQLYRNRLVGDQCQLLSDGC